MELLQAIRERRSIREYTDESVSDAVLRDLIEAAIQAPSAINQQPWCFVVVKDRALLAYMSDQAKGHSLKALLSAPAHPFRDMLNDPKFDLFYNASTLIVIAVAEPTDWAVEDCALAAQNLMLAAHDAGLGTCWIGFAQHWLGTAEGKATLGLPPSCTPIAPIVVGHPLRNAAPVPRKAANIRWLNSAGEDA